MTDELFEDAARAGTAEAWQELATLLSLRLDNVLDLHRPRFGRCTICRPDAATPTGPCLTALAADPSKHAEVLVQYTIKARNR